MELPYILITTGLFVNTFYWFVGLAAEPLSKFVFYWVFFALYITCTVRRRGSRPQAPNATTLPAKAR